MRCASLLQTTLLSLLGASLSQAQFLITELSFGYGSRIFPPESPGKIPGFTISGQFSDPELLSTKLILSPISPGNQRSSVWSDAALLHESFVVDVDFRASGPDRGSGSLNIWLAYEGSRRVGSRGIYTVNRFEGLVLVIDPYGNTGGMLRGFLNDGSVDFASVGSVDELAFGHCRFSYRNLGRPSQVKLRQTSNMFSVEIDGNTCFESNKVRIPAGYQIGVSAVTPDIADSFEVFKVVAMSDSPKVSPRSDGEMSGINSDVNREVEADHPHRDSINSINAAAANNQRSQGSGTGSTQPSDGSWENPADEDADVFQTSKAQFQDLHHRLQVTNHQLSALFRHVASNGQLGEKQHDQLVSLFQDLETKLSRAGSAQDLVPRLDRLENEVKTLRQELAQKISDNERTVRGLLSGHHETLTRRVADSVPGHGRLITVFIGTNVIFAGVYVFYKRRKLSPKKYL